MFPFNAIAGVTGEVAPGVHHKALGAGVPAVVNEGQHVATELAAVSSPRPTAVSEAHNGMSSQQLVPSIAAHLAASSQRAPVGSASRGVAGHLTIGQTQRMAPVRVCGVQLIFLCKFIFIYCSPRASCEEQDKDSSKAAEGHVRNAEMTLLAEIKVSCKGPRISESNRNPRSYKPRKVSNWYDQKRKKKLD